ncbi:MAG: hypothetical protein QM785_00050 [Pyrinomonadaceae bacterium]
MKAKFAVLMFIIAATVVSVSAQRKTITNADLEKYRLERLAAERDYRENYASRGMPSPEELEKRREESRVAAEKLSERLRSEELERERLERVAEYRTQTIVTVPQVQYLDRSYVPQYYWTDSRGYRTNRNRSGYQQPGYYAGGQFWPTGNRTPSRPLFARPRR